MQADVASSDPLHDVSPARTFWIYGLPGSCLGLRKSAGAPPLAALARGPDAEPVDRVWIFYGPPDEALEDLAHDRGASGEHDPDGRESHPEALAAWQEAMAMALQAKRLWRERLRLVNLGRSSPGQEAMLQRELPELEPDVRRRRFAAERTLPPQVLRATTLALLQLTPSLLTGYGDLESGADRFGRAPDGPHWREGAAGEELLQSLRQLAEQLGGLEQRDRRLEELAWQLRRHLEERALLEAQLQQMERELDHYVGEHERLATLVGGMESQLGRARRLLERQPPAPGIPGAG